MPPLQLRGAGGMRCRPYNCGEAAAKPEAVISLCVCNPLLRQRSSAEHFVLTKGFERREGDGGDGHGFTHRVEDFDGVPFCAIEGNMVVQKLDDVATTQPIFRQIHGEGRISIRFKLHHVFPLSGISVTNFVMPDKCSVIQIVRAATVPPFGPVSVPRIS